VANRLAADKSAHGLESAERGAHSLSGRGETNGSRMARAILPRIALATGDPAGIGPEICLKAAVDPAVRRICRPILVGDPDVVARHARSCAIAAPLRVVERIADADADGAGGGVDLLACRSAELAGLAFGAVSAASGRASLAAASAAIQAALAGDVDAVVAAPQNQKAIALAGIEFDGYPSFVARQTGLEPHDVFLMLCFGDVKIAHCTLHVSVRDAIAMITQARVARVIRVADQVLKRLGVQSPAICVSGLNPHAGETGLFGREDLEVIKPAIDAAVAEGIRVSGPFGADTMFHKRDCDVFIVMLHDQGHIAAKLQAPNAIAGLAIGSPILFSSVAHGTAHDIAGKGVADPKALVEAIARLAQASAAPSRKPRTAKRPFRRVAID
jgi:4-hydroxythreonine-4-phosphate dehydrogenase